MREVKEVKSEVKKVEDEVKKVEEEVKIIEGEISLSKLIKYNLLFFIPVFIFLYFSFIISENFHSYLSVTARTAFGLVFLPFIILVFLFIIPYIRKREKIQSFRLVVIDFLIVGIFMIIPDMLKGDMSLLMDNILYIAIYLFLTFLYAPEVLGIYGDIRQWFKHKHQMVVAVVYICILFFFIAGFAWQLYEIHLDKTIPQQFKIPDKNPTYASFFYYSVVVFVGGDIGPVGTAGRSVVVAETITSTLLNILFLAILLLYVSNIQAIKHHESISEVHEAIINKK